MSFETREQEFNQLTTLKKRARVLNSYHMITRQLLTAGCVAGIVATITGFPSLPPGPPCESVLFLLQLLYSSFHLPPVPGPQSHRSSATTVSLLYHSGSPVSSLPTMHSPSTIPLVSAFQAAPLTFPMSCRLPLEPLLGLLPCQGGQLDSGF